MIITEFSENTIYYTQFIGRIPHVLYIESKTLQFSCFFFHLWFAIGLIGVE